MPSADRRKGSEPAMWLLGVCLVVFVMWMVWPTGREKIGMAGEELIKVKSTDKPKAEQRQMFDEQSDGESVVIQLQVTEERPHDAKCFTQGLVLFKDRLYESCGLTRQSNIRQVDAKTGAVLKMTKNQPGDIFAEGLCVSQNQLVQLTWQNHKMFVFDLDLTLVKTLPLPYEGWGLTIDTTSGELLVSDGSSTLYVLDPSTFQEKRRINVFEMKKAGGSRKKQPVLRLNELEFVNGWILANVWYSDDIAIISPRTGKVVAWLKTDAISRRLSSRNSEAVLNGIAYDPTSNQLLVTGKLWPSLFVCPLPF